MQYKNGYQLPLAFLIDELKAQTENKWLEVNNCISTIIKHNDSQLVIYAFVKTTDILKVKYFLLQIANLAESLMPSFARITVYSTLMRKRTYSNYGLEKELICVIKYKKLSRIRCPSIFEAEVENHGLYCIEWNRKWLETNNNV